MAWANTSPVVKTYTLEEFWELPEHPERLKAELIAGVIYLSPPPSQVHDTIVSRIMRILMLNAETRSGSVYVPRAAIWIRDGTHLEPDLFYLSAETKAQLDPERHTTADLVIEVISPGSAIYDRNTKADTYAALGVNELWLIDEAQETVEVRVIDGERYCVGTAFEKGEELRSVVLPELAFDVARIFAD